MITNIRLGHACNSSSSHSLLLLNDGESVQTDEWSDWGWDQFTVADEETKTRYLAHAIYRSLASGMGDEAASVVLEALFGVTLAQDGSSYVDHQSTFDIPLSFDGSGPSIQFLKELAEFLFRDDIAILGGNDNGGDWNPNADKGKRFYLPIESLDQGRVRKDNWTGLWTLYNRRTGAKVRFDFNEPKLEQDKKYTKDWRFKNWTDKRPSAPELVDVKITDQCNIGCSYCYQASTPDGKTANPNDLRALAHVLADAQVFEVAIGGGEPTEQGQILTGFINDLSRNGVTPNVTTRNLQWFLDRPALTSKLGAIAFSVDGPNAVEKIAKQWNNAQDDFKTNAFAVNLRVQIVDKTMPNERLRDTILAATDAGISVTLLGYKSVGRGADYDALPRSNWVNLLEEKVVPMWRLHVDTALMREYEDEISSLGIDRRTFYTSEGAWSCYVDAVAGTMAPSSYSHEDQFVSYTPEWGGAGNFKDTFRTINVEFG